MSYSIVGGCECAYRSAAVPALPDLESAMSALVAKFEKLRLRPSFELLPDEILMRILEHLVPEPVDVQPGASLKQRPVAGKWSAFFASRDALLQVSLVNRRLSRLAGDLKFRNIFVSQPKSLCQLLAQFVERPSLARRVRYLSSAVGLGAGSTVKEMSTAWGYYSRTDFGGLRLADPLPHAHPYRRLSDWFGQTAVSGSRKLPFTIFFALLCFTNRLETLNFVADQPHRRQPRTPLWNWFLDDNHAFAESDTSVPKNIGPYGDDVGGSLTREQLAAAPCWPPPFLRDVVVEFGLSENGSNFIHLDVVPQADAAELARIHRSSPFHDILPADLVKPSTVMRLCDSEHVALRSYLDSLKRIPEIEDGSRALHAHIDALKSLTYSPSPLHLDTDQARQLGREISLLPLDPKPRLTLRRKCVSLPLYDFIYASGPHAHLEHTMTLSNVESLTLRVGDGGICQTDDYPAFWLDLIMGHCSLQRRLLRKNSPFADCLQKLHLVLRMNRAVTGAVYHRAGRLRNLQRLTKLKELTITTEGLFGGWRSLHKLFGGPKFVKMPGGEERDERLQQMLFQQYQQYPHLFAFDEEIGHQDEELGGNGSPLEDLVDGLPPALETLRLTEWYGEYVDPKWLMPYCKPEKVKLKTTMTNITPTTTTTAQEETPQPADSANVINPPDWLQRLQALQKAVATGLGELAPVLQKKRPEMKNLVFWVHKWNVPEADSLWLDWSRSKDGLKKLKKEYRDAGITLRFVMAKEGVDNESVLLSQR